ncbi:MAG: prolyl oligopeptidase family serine peptidase [Candidatus Longimicrobiales bacterium M2_2A_002]
MKSNRPVRAIPAFLAAALLVLALPVAPVAAQEEADTAQADTLADTAHADTARAPADTAPRPITPDDYGQWESPGFAELSPDGRWLAVPISRVNDEDELRIHRVGSDSVVVIGYGSRATFSDDHRWLAYSIRLSEAERDRLKEQKQRPENSVGLLDLETGDTAVVPGVSSFAFSDDGRYLAMRRYPAGEAEGDDEHGADLVVRDLGDDVDVNFGNVGEFAWQDDGHLLAMTVDAADNAGNGVRVWSADDGRMRTLHSHPSDFRELRWREDADDLVVLRVHEDEDRENPTHAVLTWTDVAGSPDVHTFDPTDRDDFPADTRVVEYRAPVFSEDGGAVFFGVQPWEYTEEARERMEAEGEPDPEPDPDPDAGSEAEEAGVEVWHSRDIDIIPRQKQLATEDRRENDLSVWHLDEDRFVRLGAGLSDDAKPIGNDELAIATDDTPYERLRMFGPRYVDVYVIDTGTGDRRKVIEQVEYFYGASPGGRYLLYLEDDQYRVYDLEDDRYTTLTAGLPAVFVDTLDDHTVEQDPPFGQAGWVEDDAAVLLYDEYDVWRVEPNGDGVRLTDGRTDSTVHRYTRVGWDEGQEAIDPAAPVYYNLTGQWSKWNGFAVADRLDRRPERRVWRDARVGWVARAEDADVFTYRVSSFDDSPDYFTATGGLREGEQLTDTNPFQSDYLWGRSELIEYENAWGRRLQGALFYPADYDPSKQYPMITYIYETRSATVHSYYVPSEKSEYNPAVWTAEGYIVFQPDIVYRDRNPGLSAVEALVPAVNEVIDMGIVDPDRIGLIGHSWGGYQTAFVPTQTDLFAAAVAGAPLTELTSMYLSVYWNFGETDARIFEINQGRMEVPPWEDWEAYDRNSPVHNIESLSTPMLVMFGTEDGAVDWDQGTIFYNAARRADKHVVLLVYEGENHGLSEDANEVDYHRRILEWFGHYLKGEPAPVWVTEGVPYLDQQEGGARPLG